MSFAKNLNRIRKSAGFTQDELARKISVTRQAISSWERGRSEPDLQTLTALAQVLNVDVNELLVGKESPQYPRYQKPFVVWSIVSFCIVFTALLLRLTLFAHLERLRAQTYMYFPLFECEMFISTAAYFFGGVFLVSFLALFTGIRVDGRWKRVFLITGAVLILPALLVSVEPLICLVFPRYTLPLTYHLYLQTTRLPYAHSVLYAFLPSLSGALLFISFYSRSTD